MSDEKKVLCPWCGNEMVLQGDAAHGAFNYECRKCGASAPWGSYTKEGALEKALRRYKPLQKPLTLEEAYSFSGTEPCVFIEDSRHMAMAAGIVEEMMPEQCCDDPCAEIHVPDTRGMVFASEKLYGKRWRCWATKPTDEERRAAKWET